MHKTRTLALVAAGSAALLGLVAVPVVTGVAQAEDASCSVGGPPIVGAWEMTVDPRPFTTPTGQTIDPPPFASLVEFHAGGTLTDAVSSVPNSPAVAPLHPDAATNSIGAWRWTGGTVTFVFDRFLTSAGRFVAKQRVVGSASVSHGCTVQDGTATVRFSTDPTDDFTGSAHQIGAPIVVDTHGTRLQP